MGILLNKIVCGDAKGVMGGFPDESVNCCISSPPYWALRDYGVEGQLGLEPTFEEYIDKLCGIYDEVKRVLRPDGTCWVNLGDTYAGSGIGTNDYRTEASRSINKTSIMHPKTAYSQKIKNIPAKSLCLIPQRFAIEMVNRGWILRNTIIWHKPNPMPSSAKDRFTMDFEYVYFFVKNNEILWHFRSGDGKVSDKQPDYKSGIEGLDWEWGERKGKRVKKSLWQGFKYWFEPQYEPYNYDGRHDTTMKPTGKYADRNVHQTGVNNSLHLKECERWPNPLGRNKRTVWTIPTQPFPEAHFATFPEKLVKPMIKAGCPEFICKKCGKARVKIYDKSGGTTGKSWHDHKNDIGAGITQTCGGEPLSTVKSRAEKENPYKIAFRGYTDCGCNAGWRPSIVLDPFMGSVVL